MKTFVAALVLWALPVLAEETVPEKAKATANDVKREVKKGAHRAGEAFCTGTKAECAAKKLGHRAEEAKDSVTDKADELKNKVDQK